jgi:hypothetical protein
MAIALRAANAGGLSAGTTASVPLPAGTTIGDVTVVLVNQQSAGGGFSDITVPSGWWVLASTLGAILCWRVFQSGDPSSVTFSTGVSGATWGYAGTSYSGCDTSSPIDTLAACVLAVSGGGASVADNYRAPSLNPNYMGSQLVVFYSSAYYGSGGTPTLPGGLTQQALDPSGALLVIGDKALTDGTATGDLSLGPWGVQSGPQFGAQVALKASGASAAVVAPPRPYISGVLQGGTGSGSPITPQLPIQPNVGDLIFLAITQDTGAPTPPTGYTLLISETFYLYYHTYVYGDTVAPSWTPSGASTVYEYVVVSGMGGVAPLIGQHSSIYGSPPQSAPSLTPATADDLLLCFFGDYNNYPQSFSSYPSLTFDADNSNPGGAPSLNAGWAWPASNPSGAQSMGFSGANLEAMAVLIETPPTVVVYVPSDEAYIYPSTAVFVEAVSGANLAFNHAHVSDTVAVAEAVSAAALVADGHYLHASDTAVFTEIVSAATLHAYHKHASDTIVFAEAISVASIHAGYLHTSSAAVFAEAVSAVAWTYNRGLAGTPAAFSEAPSNIYLAADRKLATAAIAIAEAVSATTLKLARAHASDTVTIAEAIFAASLAAHRLHTSNADVFAETLSTAALLAFHQLQAETIAYRVDENEALLARNRNLAGATISLALTESQHSLSAAWRRLSMAPIAYAESPSATVLACARSHVSAPESLMLGFKNHMFSRPRGTTSAPDALATTLGAAALAVHRAHISQPLACGMTVLDQSFHWDGGVEYPEGQRWEACVADVLGQLPSGYRLDAESIALAEAVCASTLVYNAAVSYVGNSTTYGVAGTTLGTPAGTVVGDLILVFMQCNSSYHVPAGYTLVSSQTQDSYYTMILSRIATGSDTLTFVTGDQAAYMAVYSGVSTVESSNGGVGDSVSMDSVNVTNNSLTCLGILFGWEVYNGATITNPSGVTARFNGNFTSSVTVSLLHSDTNAGESGSYWTTPAVTISHIANWMVYGLTIH